MKDSLRQLLSQEFESKTDDELFALVNQYEADLRDLKEEDAPFTVRQPIAQKLDDVYAELFWRGCFDGDYSY